MKVKGITVSDGGDLAAVMVMFGGGDVGDGGGGERVVRWGWSAVRGGLSVRGAVGGSGGGGDTEGNMRKRGEMPWLEFREKAVLENAILLRNGSFCRKCKQCKEKCKSRKRNKLNYTDTTEDKTREHE